MTSDYDNDDDDDAVGEREREREERERKKGSKNVVNMDNHPKNAQQP